MVAERGYKAIRPRRGRGARGAEVGKRIQQQRVQKRIVEKDGEKCPPHRFRDGSLRVVPQEQFSECVVEQIAH